MFPTVESPRNEENLIEGIQQHVRTHPDDYRLGGTVLDVYLLNIVGFFCCWLQCDDL